MRKNAVLLVCACLLTNLTYSTIGAAQCEGIWWEYESPVLTVHHDTEYNCGIFGFEHEVGLVGPELRVQETATAYVWTWCECPYATRIDILGLVPGDYTLRFGYGEAQPGNPPMWWDVCVLPVTVSGTDAHEAAEIEFHAHGVGCGILTTGVPATPDPAPMIWGSLKELYR
jgi:hypothetical protein